MANNMKLEEAIAHLDESLNDQGHDWGCEECKQEHEQLREWLAELQKLRPTDGGSVVRCRECKHWNTGNITGRFPDGVKCFCGELSGGLRNRFTAPDNFCCWGERKEAET